MPAGHLFKALFPSWRFFESLGAMPRIFYRVSDPASEPGPWILLRGHSKRGWAAVLLNSEGNLDLACNTLVERLAADLEEVPDAMSEAARARFFESVSYRLVRNLVEFRIRESGTSATRFQFRLCMMEPDGSPGGDLLVSPVHEVGSC